MGCRRRVLGLYGVGLLSLCAALRIPQQTHTQKTYSFEILGKYRTTSGPNCIPLGLGFRRKISREQPHEKKNKPIHKQIKLEKNLFHKINKKNREKWKMPDHSQPIRYIHTRLINSLTQTEYSCRLKIFTYYVWMDAREKNHPFPIKAGKGKTMEEVDEQKKDKENSHYMFGAA